MDSIRIGDIELVPLLDGVKDLGETMAESFPSVPDAAWPEVNAAHPGVVSATRMWRLHVRCTLIRLPTTTILVDTGVGSITSGWFGGNGQILDALVAAGTDPASIDTVVLTHAHDDHIGGTVRATGELAFPNARYVLQRADLDWQRHWAEEEEEFRVGLHALLRPLEEADVLELVEGEVQLADGVRVFHAPGHTPGHQIVDVRGGRDRVLISGDAFNHPIQLTQPDWFSGSDDEPDRANATRRTLLEELDGGDVILAPTHFAEPLGRVKVDLGSKAGWVPVGDLP